MRWVVIGSSGYIGRALCQYLVKAGDPVLSVSRRPSAPEGCEHLHLQQFSKQGFEGVFRPGDRVVYAAGLSSAGECRRRPQEAAWMNSELPAKLLALADAERADSFLYLSSVKARRAPSGTIAGEQCGWPADDVYGFSKWQGEQALLAQNVACRLNILRPAAVYGQLADSCGEEEHVPDKRAHGWMPWLKRWGKLLPLVPETGFRSFISLADLLQAICAIDGSDCDREVFIAAEPQFYDSVAMIAAASGVRVRRSRVLSAMLLWPFRLVRKSGIGARVLEVERSELYSAGRLKSLLKWRAAGRYQDFLRGC